MSAECDQDGRCTLSLAETGVGMTKDELQVAMTEFGQTDSGLDRKHEGSGLRLPLTKGLIELHGGLLELDSTPGTGTTVTVTFTPYRPHEDAIPAQE